MLYWIYTDKSSLIKCPIGLLPFLIKMRVSSSETWLAKIKAWKNKSHFKLNFLSSELIHLYLFEIRRSVICLLRCRWKFFSSTLSRITGLILTNRGALGDVESLIRVITLHLFWLVNNRWFLHQPKNDFVTSNVSLQASKIWNNPAFKGVKINVCFLEMKWR